MTTIETATQTTVIEGRSSRFGNWETLPEGVFEGPDQVRIANAALEILLALGGDYTAENTRALKARAVYRAVYRADAAAADAAKIASRRTTRDHLIRLFLECLAVGQ